MIQSLQTIKVGIDFGAGILPVGRLGINNRKIYFEFDPRYKEYGFEISPIRLAFQPGIIELPSQPFEGLAGVFNDSLPDGWGRLLFDRMLREKGMSMHQVSPLDRLANVGLYGMGALVYEPDYSGDTVPQHIDLDELSDQSQEVLKGQADEVIEDLLVLNGSSAGARPKALIGVSKDRQHIIFGAKTLAPEFEPWLVKFYNTQDGSEAGVIEYIYAQMAKLAGLVVPDIHLFPSQKNNGKGYFAVKRFDRDQNKRLHMHTAAGLLNADFRVPTLDYQDLMELTGALTKDIREVEKMFRLAVFNVLVHNRDDHAKNFSFLMDEKGKWSLSPAYDLTLSNGPHGEQSTLVMGEGRNPTKAHLLKLGQIFKLPDPLIKAIFEQTTEAIQSFSSLAKDLDLSASAIKNILKTINY